MVAQEPKYLAGDGLSKTRDFRDLEEGLLEYRPNSTVAVVLVSVLPTLEVRPELLREPPTPPAGRATAGR